MSSTENSQKQEKEYVDPILIEEGFFDDEEDYVRTMDEMFRGLRKAAEKRKAKKPNNSERITNAKESLCKKA